MRRENEAAPLRGSQARLGEQSGMRLGNSEFSYSSLRPRRRPLVALRFILGSGSPIRGGVRIPELFLDEIRETLNQLKIILHNRRGRSASGYCACTSKCFVVAVSNRLGLAVVRPREVLCSTSRGPSCAIVQSEYCASTLSMKRQIVLAKKKRGPQNGQGDSDCRADPTRTTGAAEMGARRGHNPTRPEGLRRLAEMALAAGGKGKRWTDLASQRFQCGGGRGSCGGGIPAKRDRGSRSIRCKRIPSRKSARAREDGQPGEI